MDNDRPYTILHMHTSIDGKLLGSRWGKVPGQPKKMNLFESTALKFKIGAWVVCTTTMREFSGRDRELKKTKATVPPGDFVANINATSHAIGLDRHGVLRFDENEVQGDHTVILTTQNVGDDYLAHLREANVSYLLCGKADVDLHVAMRKLRSVLGLKKAMVHGGGTFNGAMLRAGLIDEISQVSSPIVDGGGANVLGCLDAPGKATPHAAGQLKLISHKTLPGGSQWCRWKVLPYKANA